MVHSLELNRVQVNVKTSYWKSNRYSSTVNS